jgi:hypothetical protein
MEFMQRFSEAAEVDMSLEEAITQGAEQMQILLMLALFTPLAAGGLVLTCFLLYIIAKLNKRENILKSLVSKKYAEHDPVDESVSLLNPLLLAGLGLCLLMALWSAFGER